MAGVKQKAECLYAIAYREVEMPVETGDEETTREDAQKRMTLEVQLANIDGIKVKRFATGKRYLVAEKETPKK